MPIAPTVLSWARERAGYSLEAAAKEFGNIAAWERGEAAPTYPQLEKLADRFKVPVAVFFFPEPPNLPSIERSFRTLGSEQFASIPPRIHLLIRKARAFQMGLEDLNRGRNPAPRQIVRDLSFRLENGATAMASELRSYLGVPLDVQMGWSHANEALRHWRKVFADVGVYIFKDQFRDDAYSGFCLYNEEFPLIYINNSMATTRQIFTCFHELAHLLFHTSGVDHIDDDFARNLLPGQRHTEMTCNKMAAQFLVPDNEFEARILGQEPDNDTVASLANAFCVSREVIYRKFLDRSRISVETYRLAAERTLDRGLSKNGGNYYNTKLSYLGIDYTILAFQRYYQNHIDEDQLADYLDIKPKNILKMENYMLRALQ